MREIPLKQAKSILKRAIKGKTDQQLTLFTKKKDRSLTIKVQDGELILKEQGYRNDINTYQLGDGEAKHELVTAFKREFPRSHQLYINQVRE